MSSPASSTTEITIRDVLSGLEAMEQWTRQLREALATLDHEQPLSVPYERFASRSVPLVSGGRCPPGKKTGKPKKKTKK